MVKNIFIACSLFFCRACNFTWIVYKNVCRQDCRDKASKPAAGNFSHESATEDHLHKAYEVKYISVEPRCHVLPKIRFINIKSLLIRWCIGWLLFHTYSPFGLCPPCPGFGVLPPLSGAGRRVTWKGSIGSFPGCGIPVHGFLSWLIRPPIVCEWFAPVMPSKT